MASSPILTPLITSPSDLKRTRRELEELEEFLHQAGLRQGGKSVKMPNISRLLDDIAQDSKLNLLNKADRDRLKKFLTLLIQKAPVLHFTFASEPSGAALNKLLVWLRANIHPQVVVSIGIQPAIAAGCTVRTSNRQFDFSLRQALDSQTAVLMKNIRAGEEKLNPNTAVPEAKKIEVVHA
jgi:F0F1-type ATP synthase delta subunit